ncbi:MAG: helix-turn-helix domain-containing protein [Clostridia bacterium]|nr:helix-turn-helix domain-containing protein [Clostridia bacterium]
MNDVVFSKSFRFHRFSYDRYHYTDNSRGAPYHYIAYMEKGRCKIVSERGTREFEAGDVFYIPMGLKYQSYWYGTPESTFLSFGFLPFPEAEQKHFCLQKVPCPRDLTDQIRALPLQESMDSFLLGRFYTLLAKVIPLLKSGSFDSAKTVYRDAVDYLTRHPQSTVPEIARACNVSQSLLYAVFQKVAGKSPNALRLEILTDRAVQLLITTDRQVQEISDSLGFSSVSYFRKILKAHTGKTPSQIRQSSTIF